MDKLVAGQRSEAENLFKLHLRDSPEDAVAKHYLGILLTQRAGQKPHGLKLILESKRLVKQDAFFYNIVSTLNVLVDINESSLLEDVLDGILQERKGHGEIESLVKLYLRIRSPLKAIKAVEEGAGINQFFRKFYTSVAFKLLGKIHEANGLFADALRVQPVHYCFDRKSPSSRDNILILHTGELHDFKPILKADISFEIGVGSYDLNALLSLDDFDVTRVFLVDSEALWGQLDDMRECKLIINAVSDPEVASDSLAIASELCKKIKRQVINPPERVLGTSREDVATLADSIEGIFAPPTIKIEVKQISESFLSQNKFLPFRDSSLLVRPLGSSTGIGLTRIDSLEKLLQIDAQNCPKWINVTKFVDFRSADDLYRKYRVFVIDGDILPEHCVISTDWNIHSSSRMNEMLGSDIYREEERDFLRSPRTVLSEENMKSLQLLGQKIGLNYIGIDFSLTPDGRLLLFEANSGMRVNHDYNESFSYLEKYTLALRRRFDKMVRNKIQQG
ncbi:MAG: hypothetical protein ED554_00025 [Synechococcus sp. YX04-3]|nr:MAG: hypothetical protein ED554_00025 [Synechococcus sp. YX04-3]